MQSSLEAARTLFGPAPRRIVWKDHFYFYPPAPQWIERDELKRVYNDRKLILQQGRLVLGVFIQANSLLYQPGTADLPAFILWSEDPYFLETPAHLRELARELGNLKGTSPTGDMAEVTALVTNELARPLGYRMPASFGEGRPLWMTTLMVFRRHLPSGFITSGLVPLLVRPEESPVALILPGRFWPDEWKDR
jgi:hypothetical protein